jgi:Golgi SNAP receptor complex protein 2
VILHVAHEPTGEGLLLFEREMRERTKADYSMTRSSLGQISASLAAMHRTVDDYDSMAKREIIKAKQEKALM